MGSLTAAAGVMQLKDALAQGIDLLERANIPSHRLTAEVLLMHAARCDRTFLYAHPERELTDTERIHYGRYLHERMQGKPAQYITGHQEFWGLDFLVNPAVLIPRPETEVLVEAVLELARHNFPHDSPLHIADVGTGSGCIAVALARELPQAVIYALEASEEALGTARENARRHGLAERIQFLRSDLLEGCVGEAVPELQMVVSNPPYVSLAERETLMVEVRNHEPSLAVFAGETGGEVYARLIPQAARTMSSGGFLALELGYDSRRMVEPLLQPPEWADVHWLPDLAGIVRVVTARRVAAAGTGPEGDNNTP